MAIMDALSESAEMMIKNIHELSMEGERVRTSDLAQKTDLKPATVTEMIQRLGEIGLVDYQAYHGVFLTKQGQHVADVIEHRFNILQRFLTEILGVEEEEAAEVACRMEHILTKDVENRLSNFLGVDSGKDSDLFCHKVNIDSEKEPEFIPLTNFKEGKTGKVRLILEKSELTNTLEQAGLSPGRNVIVKKANGKSYDIETEDGSLTLDSDLAAKIIIQN
jgi:DtxR family Mn-dependent transcriptional regulator|tara:strand:- start:324 stop:983 length:660 start_codon:yes stop_codon:yes gene_type:complete